MKALNRFAMVRWLAAILVVIGSAVLVSSARAPTLTVHDKAYYLEPRVADFVRPGLVLKPLSVEVARDKTVRARFKLTDPKGIPLDIDGITTPGPIRVLLVMAYIPADSSQYVTLTTRPPATPSRYISAQPFYDSISPTFQKVSDGVYDYTFTTKLPANDDPNATHTIGIRAARNLSDFGLPTDVANEVMHFVPSGGEVKKVRDVVRTATCNARCHDPLQVHPPASAASAVSFGGNRKVEMCVMCHNPGNIIPADGQSVNFPVFIHKIHMGASLPSVKAGEPFKIGTSDFSTINFPADVRNCEVCHDQKSGAAQADAYLKPSRAACGACHDDVNFATGEKHVDLPQVSDNQCSTCHVPLGELEFDASIKGAHAIERFSRDLPGTTFEILSVDDGVAGKRPIVTFTVKEKTGKPILASDMDYLALVLSGPTSDYPGMTTERVERAEGPGDGRHYWTFQDPIPANARGTYAVAIEGYRSVKLLPGTKQERTVRDVGTNKLLYFSVDGSRIEMRRTVVEKEKCNACHFDLALHGTVRNRIEHCVQCHNPNQTDAANRPADKMPAQTIAFKTMIHRIHTGEESKTEYTVYGRGGRAFDFTEVRFPGDRRNCQKCHVNGSEQLPLQDNLLSVVNPRGLLNPMGPTAAACLGCHTSKPVAAHAYSMTTPLGEACAVCHGKDAEFSVDKVHAR